MKRRLAYLVAGAAVATALGIARCPRTPNVAPRRVSAPVPASPSVQVSERPVERTPTVQPPIHDSPAPSAGAPAPGVVQDRDELGLLRMYDEMADAIEMSTDDCDAIEYAFATAIEGGIPHLKALMSRARASRSQARDAKDPVLALAKERMSRLFAMLRKLPPECGRQLSAELRRLTESKF